MGFFSNIVQDSRRVVPSLGVIGDNQGDAGGIRGNTGSVYEHDKKNIPSATAFSNVVAPSRDKNSPQTRYQGEESGVATENLGGAQHHSERLDDSVLPLDVESSAEKVFIHTEKAPDCETRNIDDVSDPDAINPSAINTSAISPSTEGDHKGRRVDDENASSTYRDKHNIPQDLNTQKYTPTNATIVESKQKKNKSDDISDVKKTRNATKKDDAEKKEGGVSVPIAERSETPMSGERNCEIANQSDDAPTSDVWRDDIAVTSKGEGKSNDALSWVDATSVVKKEEQSRQATMHTKNIMDRPEGANTVSDVKRPQVRVGQVNVVVQSKVQQTSQRRTHHEGDLTSRLFLRGF